MSGAARVVAAALLGSMLMANATADPARWTAEVTAAERAFARSMAERRLDDFRVHLSAQALFFGPKGSVLRGRDAVVAGWQACCGGAAAPFSWEPDQVEVLADGTLALSTGPVRNPKGEVVARFNSIWRQEAPGVWRVVFDKGQPPD